MPSYWASRHCLPRYIHIPSSAWIAPTFHFPSFNLILLKPSHSRYLYNLHAPSLLHRWYSSQAFKLLFFGRISSSKPKIQSKWSVHSPSCWPSHLHHMIFKPPRESKSDVWCTRRLRMSRPGVMDVERLDFCGTSACGSSHMCCSASWACSVYTSSFPTHEPKSKCAFRCEPRCLSREKKLNLGRRTEDRGQKTEDRSRISQWGFTATHRCVSVQRIKHLNCSVRGLHFTAVCHVRHWPVSININM